MPQYRVLSEGLSYQSGKGEKHLAQGALVDGADLGEKSIKWLVAEGIIELAKDSDKAAAKTASKGKG